MKGVQASLKVYLSTAYLRQSFAYGLSQLRYAFRAEEDEHNHEDEQELTTTDIEHYYSEICISRNGRVVLFCAVVKVRSFFKLLHAGA